MTTMAQVGAHFCTTMCNHSTFHPCLPVPTTYQLCSCCGQAFCSCKCRWGAWITFTATPVPNATCEVPNVVVYDDGHKNTVTVLPTALL